MNTIENIKDVLKRVELCTAVMVNDVYHTIDYTVPDVNYVDDIAIGYSNPDTGEEYGITLDMLLSKATFEGGNVNIDGITYRFKQLHSVNMDPTTVNVLYKTVFNKNDILTEALYVANLDGKVHSIIDENKLIEEVVNSIHEGGCTYETSIADIIRDLHNLGILKTHMK